jgi:hypothetical protein
MIVDWAGGGSYSLDGKVTQFGGYGFGDSAISSANGDYVFIYQKLGTKGLLLKNGQLLREINRSYYFAGAYEFPAVFITLGSKTYLVHCPVAYNQLDFEDVETGEIITNIKNRKPQDRFHSRLEINADGTYMMSKGWVWHPLDMVMIFNIKECINNPLLLDDPQSCPNVGLEVCTASFIDGDSAVVGSFDRVIDEIGDLPPKHICIWDLKTNKLSNPVAVKENFGNLFAINAKYAWDMFGFPKIIDLETGKVIEQNKKINSGKQRSSIINDTDDFPSIIFNKRTGQIAVKAYEKIEVLTPNLALK